MSDLSRITFDPDICHGKPCIRHMRWPVEVILDLVSSGMTLDDILADHPELDREDILACLHYAIVTETSARDRCYLELSREGIMRLP